MSATNEDKKANSEIVRVQIMRMLGVRRSVRPLRPLEFGMSGGLRLFAETKSECLFIGHLKPGGVYFAKCRAASAQSVASA
jgi:hypothetical protein